MGMVWSKVLMGSALESEICRTVVVLDTTDSKPDTM